MSHPESMPNDDRPWWDDPRVRAERARAEKREDDLEPSLWNHPLIQARRDHLLEEELARRGHPCNPKNAARAGWYAGIRLCREVEFDKLSDVHKAHLAVFLKDRVEDVGGQLRVDQANDLVKDFLDEIKRVSVL